MNINISSKSRSKGALIAFEGISGAGKSHVICEVYNFYRNRNQKAAIVEWNSNSLIRKIMKLFNKANILTKEVYSFLQWISFLIDYFTVILPLLRKDYYVIADRYIYTGLTRDVVNGAKFRLGQLISLFVRQPDYIYFIDTPPDVCLERIEKRGKPLFHTNKRILRSKLLQNRTLYYLKKLRREYIKLFKDLKEKANIKIIFMDNSSVLVESNIDEVKVNKPFFMKGGNMYGEDFIFKAKV